eukprot:scaffold22644_cov44-Cyclotella_meneghiniana.AAC.4
MSQDGYDLSSKSIYATTQESSGFDASDFSLVGSGFCVDSGDNFYPRFALKLTNSAQAENFCLDWCAQNTNPDLVGVHVYAGPSDLTVCQCLFSGGLPLGIESTDYDPPATFEHTVNSPGKGPITQTNGNSDWECYKNNWRFNTNGAISNVACPELKISSNKEKDISLSSTYFALENPRTELAIGISADSCHNEMTLEMQDLAYGSPNQQFIYIEDNNKIVSLMCPNFAVTIPDGDCSTEGGLYLSNDTYNDNRNKWSFDDNDQIHSLECENKLITIHGAAGGRTRTASFSSKKLLKESSLPSSPESNSTNYNSTNYTEASGHTTVEWDEAKTPAARSAIGLSHSNAERYQKWTKERQLFRPLMGPFSIVNPNSGSALTVDDGTCANGMNLSSAPDDIESLRQKFYLGQHGSIFSAQCPGLVIAADPSHNDTNIEIDIKLQNFRINENTQKWKFINGMIESVSNSGMVLANNPNQSMKLQSNSTAISDLSIFNWKRVNTRLLVSNDQSEWKQQWTVSFTSPGHDSMTLDEYTQDEAMSSICYKHNPAFSASFENFAKQLVVNDAGDEEQCRKVREELGFDKDHPFDTEVRDNFYQHQCDPFFTGIDHVSGLDKSINWNSDGSSTLKGPPKFEMVDYTPVEYEAVEYDEKDYVTVDYEEFTKGDDLGELSETTWPDLYSPEEGLGDLTEILSLDSNEAEDQESLVKLQRHWHNLGHTLKTAEFFYEKIINMLDGQCDMIIEAICVPVVMGNGGITIAYQAVDDIYDIATLGPNTAIYGQYYDRANYLNIRGLMEWNEKALDAIRLNMKNQHTEMKKQLQERHRDITNHLGQDIADTQNALGQAIVEAQNDIGKGIIDSQNELGQGIVDAQNALGQDSQNYITLQHNVLGEWLHTSLCVIYEALDGTCSPEVGPFKEDQVQSMFSIAATDEHGGQGKNDNIPNFTKANAYDSGLEAVKNKVDALSSDMRDMQGKVDLVEVKVDSVKSELKELKDMISTLMGMMAKDDSE